MQTQHICCHPASTARRLAAPSARRQGCWRRAKRTACTAAANPTPAAAEAAAGTTATEAAGGLQVLALKEWAPTCAAIANGEQTVLLRKGGIKEPTFKPAASEFLLFPTSFHTDAQLLKPEAAQRYAQECSYDPKEQLILSLGTRAVVTGAWTTHDPSVLSLLDELHVWGPGFLENRLRWRQSQPITVLELRAVRLPVPLVLLPREDYFGCFSWVDLTAPTPTAPAAGSSSSSQAEQQQQQQQQEQQGAESAAPAVSPQQAARLAMKLVGTPALEDAEFEARQALCRRQLAQLADLKELPLL